MKNNRVESRPRPLPRSTKEFPLIRFNEREGGRMGMFEG